jgi:hypothetical protein
MTSEELRKEAVMKKTMDSCDNHSTALMVNAWKEVIYTLRPGESFRVVVIPIALHLVNYLAHARCVLHSCADELLEVGMLGKLLADPSDHEWGVMRLRNGGCVVWQPKRCELGWVGPMPLPEEANYTDVMRFIKNVKPDMELDWPEGCSPHLSEDELHKGLIRILNRNNPKLTEEEMQRIERGLCKCGKDLLEGDALCAECAECASGMVQFVGHEEQS